MSVEVVDTVAHFHETVVQVGELRFVRLEGCCGRFVCFVVWDRWRVVRRVGTGFFTRGGGGGGYDEAVDFERVCSFGRSSGDAENVVRRQLDLHR